MNEKFFELMKLSWLIWKMAEASGDLESFYFRVFEKIFPDESSDERILEALGAVGG